MSILWKPNPGPQTAFLSSLAREVLYGGAAGGGKTDALIASSLRHINHPKHRALILRRTRPQLQEIVDRTWQLFPDVVPGAVWREAESRWKFPSGAIIQLGHAEHEKDIFNYKSFEYNEIYFDELTSFTEQQYLFMFLRNRTKSRDLPPLIRSATNPGDVGHDWVFRRFVENREPYEVYDEKVKGDGFELVVSRQFIPSRVWDNPALPNRDAYIAGILQMSPEDIAAYLYGEWTKLAGAMFKKPLLVASSNDLLDPEYLLIRSIDFGISDPTVVLWLVYYPKANVIDVVSELWLEDATLDQIIHHIKAREIELHMRFPVASVGSPEMLNKQATSNQSIATMMGSHGIGVDRGNTDRIAGWARIQNLIQRNGVRVWPGGTSEGPWGAPQLSRSLPTLQRNTGLGKDPNDLRPRQNDHAADALRYGVMVIFEGTQWVAPKEKEPDDPNRDYVFDKMVKDLQKGNKGRYIPDLGDWG